MLVAGMVVIRFLLSQCDTYMREKIYIGIRRKKRVINTFSIRRKQRKSHNTKCHQVDASRTTTYIFSGSFTPCTVYRYLFCVEKVEVALGVLASVKTYQCHCA